MKLIVVGKTYGINRGVIERVAKATFSYLPKRNGEIELKFVTEREIQELNRTYRDTDAPTDVLSFNIANEPLVGQIVICYTYTKAQAKRLHKTLEGEVSLLTVHGILHIFGFDHESSVDEAKMQELEKEILGSEGIVR